MHPFFVVMNYFLNLFKTSVTRLLFYKMFFMLFSFFPFLLILNCLFIFLFKRYLGPKGTFYFSIMILLFSIGVSIFNILTCLTDGSYWFLDLGRWFFVLDLIDSHLLFCGDLLAYVCSILVLSLTIISLYFGVEYMYREAFINRLLYLLFMFATSVVLLFFSYDFFLILVAWELIGLFSFLLVNFYSIRIYTMKAALKTFIFSRLSDMFMFFTFILAVLVFSTTDLSIIFLQVPFFLFHKLLIGNWAFHFLSVFSASLAISGLIKAAQFFFHVWLPDAMEAPTPASALIHSSTLVVAGIFLIIRFGILFEFTPEVNYFIALWGATTVAFGAIAAYFQSDIKKLVAYSTISQIGYLVCGCGYCCYEEVLLYLIMHAINKALLFIMVGYIVHYFNGNTDMRFMGGTFLYAFDIAIIIVGLTINLIGLPYGAGFYAKEFLLYQISKNNFFSYYIRACWMVSFFFTPLYMLLLLGNSLFGPKRATLQTYNSAFQFNYYYAQRLASFVLEFRWNSRIFNRHRYQYTLFNNRLSTILFFSIWVSYLFCGESCMLILFGYSAPLDVICSSQFFSIKNSLVFSINFNSSLTSNMLMYIILIYTIFACLDFFFGYYLKHTYTTVYEIFKDSLWILFVFALVFFYFPSILIWLLFIVFLFYFSLFFMYVYYRFEYRSEGRPWKRMDKDLWRTRHYLPPLRPMEFWRKAINPEEPEDEDFFK